MKERMKKRFVFWLLLLLAATRAVADGVSVEQAEAVARRFFARPTAGQGIRQQTRAPRLVARGRSGGYYLYAPQQGEGFVVVAGDDRLPEILGYATQGRCTEAALPPALGELLRAYDGAARRLSAPPAASRLAGRDVPPLLTSVRHQEEPYNGLCPYYIDDLGRPSETRCLVGCVATSLEQVMTYYRYPEALLDTLYGWATEHYALEDVMPGTRIDWERVLPDYAGGYTEAEARAVQEISLYCGMSCRMQYGVNASGARLSDCPETLRRVFGYAYARFHDRFLYTPDRWNRMLRHELENGRPVVYTGHNVEMSGHAFVVDGVDAAGYYHLDWGYGGSYDGYFDLDVLNPFEALDEATEAGRYEGFFCNQTALFMHPQAVEPLPGDTLDIRPEDVTVDRVEFLREPDTRGYVPVDFYLTNRRADTLTYTFEVMTFLPTDTAVFRQAEFVGLSGATLLPGRQTRATAYCRFGRTGDFLLGCSYDDVHIPYTAPITVVRGEAPRLVFSHLRIDSLASSSARFLLQIDNEAPSGSAGGLLTYCLFAGDEADDMRHWTFLNLPAGASITDTVRFGGLQSGTDYVLKARYPWAVVAELPFTFTGSTPVTAAPADAPVCAAALYTLQGRLLGRCPDAAGLHALLSRLRLGCYVVRRADGSAEKICLTP